MPLTVGTAGHIDHGKTWLVRALTGKDTDRLPEEKARGISIDLGYAPLTLPDGRQLSLIDVPGHERFVRTMVAGATGIDLFLLVIDAAEGARPQTHEHLAVLRLLGVTEGVVAVTKADAVDPETLALALAEARELVPTAEAVAVSAKTGVGVEALRVALAGTAARIERAPPLGATRLFVDRVFSLRGIGTVATGTLWAGSIAAGDELRAEPSGRTVRVRSVEVHDRPVTRAEAGQRVAVALPGVERAELRRGDALVEPDAYPVSYRLDIALEELAPIRDGARVQLHHGTTEATARVVRGEGRWAQLRLAAPVVAARGDRVILRSGTTVGGGLVIDPAPPRGIGAARLEPLAAGDPEAIVAAVLGEPVRRETLAARGLLAPAELDRALRAFPSAGVWHFSEAWLAELRERIAAQLAERARSSPLDPGLPLAELLPEPWAPDVAPLLDAERRGAKLYAPGAAASLGDRAREAEDLERLVAAEAPNAARVEDRELAAFLEAEGRVVRLGDGLAVSRELFDRGRELVVDECGRSGTITLGRFRDLLGSSRRTAQLVLERLDAEGLTRRVGDLRLLRRAARR